MSRACNWTFTVNNYTPDNEALIGNLVDSNESVQYVVYGREVGENGTPHLQGYISFCTRKRMSQVRDVLGCNAHLECARLPKQAAEYCKKGGDYVEFGTFPSGSGTRNDLDAFKNDVKQGMLKLADIREAHSDVYAKYPRFCLEYVQDHYPEREVEEHELRDWQTDLKVILDGEPNDRTVNFVVDVDGNKGKTWFAHWYCKQTKNAQVLLPGRKQDMAFALDTTARVLFVDAPRAKQGDFLQYDFLEDVKNGYVFSTKYESRVRPLGKVHVVVCMNEEPDMTKLSEDRYNIIRI